MHLVAQTTVEPGGETPLTVAAVARRLGVAPATLRTWDRRYGVGPSDHRPGAHRRYTEEDLTRLATMRRLLLAGVTTAEAAQAVTEGSPDPAPPEAGTSGSRRSSGHPVPARQLRESTARLDGGRMVALLSQAVARDGVTATWDMLLRPTLRWLGDRWSADVSCVAQEHLLSECATTVLHGVVAGADLPPDRPVLLACAPEEAHVLPLQALAAALAERHVPTLLLGASTPPDAVGAAVATVQPAAVVIWAHSPTTADPQLFSRLPPARGGRLLAAAGPGWTPDRLPGRVLLPDSLTAALTALGAADER